METGTRPPTATEATAAPHRAPRTGWAAFDALGLVQPGRVLLVDIGCGEASRLLMRLLAGTVATGKEAVIVDGGNWLDVYDLGDAARAFDLRRDDVLASVRIARGFTAYQLQSLVEDALPRALAEGKAGLALLSCLPDMYLDEDLRPSEAHVLVTRAMETARDLAREQDVPVVVSNRTLAPGRKHRLRSALEAGADHAVALLPAPHGALRILARGMTAPLLAPHPGTRQRLLGDFEATPDVPKDAFVRHSIDARIKYMPKRAGEMRFHQREAERGQRMLATGGA